MLIDVKQGFAITYTWKGNVFYLYSFMTTTLGSIDFRFNRDPYLGPIVFPTRFAAYNMINLLYSMGHCKSRTLEVEEVDLSA